MQKRRREELFNLFCAGGKTQISLSDVLSGVMTALTQAHGRQSVIIYRRFYRVYKWAFHDTTQIAAKAAGREKRDEISYREFRLLLVHLDVYATWYEIFAHTIIVVQPDAPHGGIAPPVPRRLDPFEYWSEVDHKFLREEWVSAIAKVREAGRTWAPYLRLRDATAADFDDMDVFAGSHGHVDFRAFCSWIHEGETAAGTAIGLQLVDPHEDSVGSFAERISTSPTPTRLAIEAYDDLRNSYLSETGPWSGPLERRIASAVSRRSAPRRSSVSSEATW